MTTDLELSVEENLLIFAKLYGVSQREAQPADSGAAGGRGADASGPTNR